MVSIGIVNASLAHPREIFRWAIIAGATSILIAHNHPSQNADASDADLDITKKLQQAGDIIGIPLLDHVIFTLNHYCSFKERSFM